MNFSDGLLDDVLLSIQKTISESWIGVSFIRIIKNEVIFGKAPRLLRENGRVEPFYTFGSEPINQEGNGVWLASSK